MTESILPHELPQALDRGTDALRVLSLDCFDTLLWRDCQVPTDVFAGLSAVTTGQRIIAEKHARKAQGTLHRSTEVGLPAIYAQAMPNAPAADREAAIEAELAAEAAVCYAFEPTVELMRAAKSRGHRVIIVSDTYLDADQLIRLITKAAGDEVAGLIDRVFASSQAGISKSQGLLAKALKAIKCSPQEVLHIGDNQTADYEAARALGIPALHLLQFGEAAKQRFRFERSCQQIIGEAADDVRGLMPHRALLSHGEPQITDPAEALGMSVLGPVFNAFDQWLRQEASALAAAKGGKVHWLFMLRDGHLPYLVHQTGGEAESTARIEISRFTAIAASLTTREAYQKQFALEFGLNPSTLARQMLFDEDEISRVVGDPQGDSEMVNSSLKLLDELRKGQREKLTRRRARARADRMIEHVRSAVDPQPGDTLMLVDLGYNGSAQDRVDALLSDAFNVHVAGRYLLLREMAATGLDKKGLIDDRHFDAELLEAMSGNVAVIEQLATCELGSVADFTDAGEPIRTQISVKGAQSDVRSRVQAGVARFASAANVPPIIRRDDIHAPRAWRETAASTLTRFMFLPQPSELAVLKTFEHDVNLGSERMVGLFDEALAKEGMRRRGLFYMKGASRMFLPAELAHEDMNTRLSLLVQNRFGLGLSYSDSSVQRIAIPAFYVGEDDSTHTIIHAEPTHEGYYTARLPLAGNVTCIALQVGSVFDWFELASTTRSAVNDLKGDLLNDAPPQRIAAQFDGITEHATGIFECTDPAAFVLVNPPAQVEGGGSQMIEIVMRPLRRRVQPIANMASSNPDLKPELKDAAA